MTRRVVGPGVPSSQDPNKCIIMRHPSRTCPKYTIHAWGSYLKSMRAMNKHNIIVGFLLVGCSGPLSSTSSSLGVQPSPAAAPPSSQKLGVTSSAMLGPAPPNTTIFGRDYRISNGWITNPVRVDSDGYMHVANLASKSISQRSITKDTVQNSPFLQASPNSHPTGFVVTEVGSKSEAALVEFVDATTVGGFNSPKLIFSVAIGPNETKEGILPDLDDTNGIYVIVKKGTVDVTLFFRVYAP